MKKAKFLLTAIGVLSVVGGVLAFKAHRIGNVVCSTTANGPTSLCNIIATTNLNAPGPFRSLYCTPGGGACTSYIIVKTTM